MVKYAHQITYGKNKDKFYYSGITCPNCGSCRLTVRGREQFYGRGFICQECDEKFYIKLVKVTAIKPVNPGKFRKFTGRLQHNSVSQIE